MAKQYDAFPFVGGVDENTPHIQRNPGSLYQGLNYEPDPDGGYRYMDGYERFDGRVPPSEVQVFSIEVDASFETEPALGGAITGDTSGATAMYVGQDQDTVFVALITGTFQANETLNGTTVTTQDTPLDVLTVLDRDEALELIQRAKEYQRQQVQEVPGSGPVRAAFELDNVVYAIRDNVGGTAANIYRDTPTGWQLIDTSDNFVLRYDNGQLSAIDPFVIGDTVTGGTSGATGIVVGVANQSSSRVEGYVALKTVTGTFSDDEELQVESVYRADANGTLESISISAGGSYEMIAYNFYGFTSTNSIYFTNGQQFAFQFDGEALSPIETPVERGNPNYVIVHHDHLFFSFDGGIMIHSTISEPLSFRGDLGAAEFALGANITGFIAAPLALVIPTESNVQALYGNNTSDWVKSIISSKSVGAPGSGQYLLEPLIMDRSGLLALAKVEAYGNFQDATISDNIRNTANRIFDNITGSLINKTKNHYYVFTSTGENILAGFSNNSFLGYFPFNLGRPVLFSSANEDRLFFTGAEGGFVYEWQKGTSHDGESIQAYVQTSYAFQGQPQRRKRYRRATISLQSFVRLSLDISFSFNKGSGLTNETRFAGSSVGGGGKWDLGRWNTILWDGQDVPEIINDIDGAGTDISMFIYSDSAFIESFVIEDIIIEYSSRAIKR